MHLWGPRTFPVDPFLFSRGPCSHWMFMMLTFKWVCIFSANATWQCWGWCNSWGAELGRAHPGLQAHIIHTVHGSHPGRSTGLMPRGLCCEREVGYSFLASSTTHFLNKLQVLLIIPRRVNFSHATLLFSVPLFKKKEVQQSSIAYCQTSCDLDKPSYFPQQAWRETLFAEYFSAHDILFHVLEFPGSHTIPWCK